MRQCPWEDHNVIDLVFWAPVICSGALAGASTGMLGTFVVGMRVPFLGVCISHAALAGAVFGSLCGLTGPMLMLPALAGAVTTALLLGMFDLQSARIDSNVLLGILFSLTMGLSFLGLGLFSVYGISDNEVRSLLWGSLNFCRWSDFAIIATAAGVELIVVLLFYKELRNPVLAGTCLCRRHTHNARLDDPVDSYERCPDRQLPNRRRLDDLRPVDQPSRSSVSARPRIWQVACLLNLVRSDQRTWRLSNRCDIRLAHRRDDRHPFIATHCPRQRAFAVAGMECKQTHAPRLAVGHNDAD